MDLLCCLFLFAFIFHYMEKFRLSRETKTGAQEYKARILFR